MTNIIFDFRNINSYSDFYKIFESKLSISYNWGQNLDAFWDVITGMINTPINIEFQYISNSKCEKFKDLISLLEDAKKEYPKNIYFKYFMI